MLSQSRLITTQQHTEQVSLLRWLKNAWKKLKWLTKLRWSSTCDPASQCPLQEAETDFPQAFQGRKTTTRILADATTLLSGRGREDPTILEALWWGVLLLGQISFLDFVFCFCDLTWTYTFSQGPWWPCWCLCWLLHSHQHPQWHQPSASQVQDLMPYKHHEVAIKMHLRFSQYKMKTPVADQETRRARMLEHQKSKRDDLVSSIGCWSLCSQQWSWKGEPCASPGHGWLWWGGCGRRWGGRDGYYWGRGSL